MSMVVRRVPPTIWPQSKHIAKRFYPIPLLRERLVPIPRSRKINFARDLQDRLGILALLALYAPFRICKLLIPLVDGETDPVSGHHLESITYRISNLSLRNAEAFYIFGKHLIFNELRTLNSSSRKKRLASRIVES